MYRVFEEQSFLGGAQHRVDEKRVVRSVMGSDHSRWAEEGFTGSLGKGAGPLGRERDEQRIMQSQQACWGELERERRDVHHTYQHTGFRGETPNFF